MRLVLIFLAIVTFSLAMGSTIMTMVATSGASELSSAPAAGTGSSLQGYVTVTVLPVEEGSQPEEGEDPSYES